MRRLMPVILIIALFNYVASHWVEVLALAPLVVFGFMSVVSVGVALKFFLTAAWSYVFRSQDAAGFQRAKEEAVGGAILILIMAGLLGASSLWWAGITYRSEIVYSVSPAAGHWMGLAEPADSHNTQLQNKQIKK